LSAAGQGSSRAPKRDFVRTSLVARPYKTEAEVLRSLRLGEADRVLHLYTRERGRVGAIAKGVRRLRSRLGGRLEPLVRVRLVLHEGRGELCTVTQADTLHAHAGLRERRESLERATQACDAVLRLLDSSEPNAAAFNLLCNELGLLDADPTAATRAQALAFRLKLLLAAGFAPELASCASCGGRERLAAFSPAAGGVVCASCEAGSFPLSAEAHTFLAAALARPLAEAPDASDPALVQADRALAETLEHHAHVRLRRVA
jgi:DNA repair protein RecO (recombination protein O)